MLLPHLKITPDRLFGTYTFDQKAKIVDTEVLGLDGQKTRGWKSGNVLRHLGLTREFKNIFEGYSIAQAIDVLNSSSDDFSTIITLLQSFT